MIRLGKLTDYGIMVMAVMAVQNSKSVHNARQLSVLASLPLPTVSKLLKLLCQGGLVESHRGVRGGYKLSKEPSSITVTEMIRVLEGEIALTDCAEEGPCSCGFEQSCPTKGHWKAINQAVRQALSNVSLQDMIEKPKPSTLESEKTFLPVVRAL
jgi:FeS assembly SUF system regulator